MRIGGRLLNVQKYYDKVAELHDLVNVEAKKLQDIKDEIIVETEVVRELSKMKTRILKQLTAFDTDILEKKEYKKELTTDKNAVIRSLKVERKE